jgi:nucleoside-diphosphate-sugar epimerase
MKILFTGATGVLGRASVPLLISDGHDVAAVYRSDREARWLEEVGARPTKADLFDRESVDQAMPGVDTVVHFATSIPPQTTMARRSSWDMNDRLRSTATEILVDAAIDHGVERFVQESISFIYADGGDEWLDESAPIAPVWDVLESALTAETHVDRFRASGGQGLVLRLARLYGPGPASREYVDAVRNHSIPIVGKGSNYVSSIHSGDAATALAAAMSAPEGTYNIADDAPMRSAENLAALVTALDAPKPGRVPSWMARAALRGATSMLTVSHRVSNEAFKSVTGWQPAFPSAVEGWEQVVRSIPEA